METNNGYPKAVPTEPGAPWYRDPCRGSCILEILHPNDTHISTVKESKEDAEIPKSTSE